MTDRPGEQPWFAKSISHNSLRVQQPGTQAQASSLTSTSASQARHLHLGSSFLGASLRHILRVFPLPSLSLSLVLPWTQRLGPWVGGPLSRERSLLMPHVSSLPAGALHPEPEEQYFSSPSRGQVSWLLCFPVPTGTCCAGELGLGWWQLTCRGLTTCLPQSFSF